MYKFALYFCYLSIAISLSGCYRFPKENYCSTRPSTGCNEKFCGLSTYDQYLKDKSGKGDEIDLSDLFFNEESKTNVNN